MKPKGKGRFQTRRPSKPVSPPTHLLLFLVVLLPAILCARASHLEQRDLISPGDGLITYDPSTHLEWLDVLRTAGMSYNQVQASGFYTTYGFTHATSEQMDLFVGDAVSSPFTTDTFSTKADMLADPWAHDVLQLYRLFSGDPKMEPGNWDYIWGVLSDPANPWDPSDTSHRTRGWRFRIIHDDLPSNEDPPDPYILDFSMRIDPWDVEANEVWPMGHFLVRETFATPEPSSWTAGGLTITMSLLYGLRRHWVLRPLA